MKLKTQLSNFNLPKRKKKKPRYPQLNQQIVYKTQEKT